MKSKNILLVEDKGQEKKLFEYLISQIHAFQSFDSCKEALVNLANQKPDLILISVQITDLEPLIFLQKVRALMDRSCLVVALASTTDQTQTAYYLEQGFDDLISKSIRPKEFILKIQSLLQKQVESLIQLLELNALAEPSTEILQIIHTIKGNSGTLGVEKIYAAAKQSESLGRLQKRIEFTESLHYLKATLVEFQEYLKKEPSLYHAQSN